MSELFATIDPETAELKIAALPWKKPVRAKTAAALAANTYANGTSGVGATLTANANGALAAQDGVTLAVNDRLLVDQESTAAKNGIYVLTQLGDASHPYILTRATDANSGANLVNATVKVSEGSTFADQEWQCTNNSTITVGTTALLWAQAGGGSIAVKDEGSALGSASTFNFTGAAVSATVSGGVATINVTGTGGGSGNTPTVRNSYTNVLGTVSSTTVTWPTGTAAGDAVIIFVSHGWGIISPSGWTVIDNTSQTNWSGAVFGKIMTSADIAAGSVTINFSGGSYNGVVSAVTLTGTTVNNYVSVGRTSSVSGATSASELISNILSTDLLLCFASTRANTTSSITNSGATALSSNAGTNASGAVASLTGSAGVFGLTVTNSFGSSGTGYYVAAVAFR